VNPNGSEVSECKFEYGTTNAYGTAVPCSPSKPGSGTGPVAVSASVGSLTANTTYHFRISATNSGGTSKGSDETLTTLANAPTVVTKAASSLTQTTVSLNATVNPNGSEVSECKFEYGTTNAYGSSAPCTPAPGSGTGPVAVSASVGSLTANTTYHFRIVATNPGGTSDGSDETLTTLANASPAYWYRNGAKIAQGVKVPIISWGTLTLHSAEDPVTCHTVGGGYIENPVGGGTGIDRIESFTPFFSCAAPACPAVNEVKAEKLPWPSELIDEGEGVITEKSTGIALRVKCFVPATTEEAEQVMSNVVFSGEWTPSIQSGTSATKPSFVDFGAGSGHLESEDGPGETIGREKLMGYEEEEVITAK
jgi:hypothetical protein